MRASNHVRLTPALLFLVVAFAPTTVAQETDPVDIHWEQLQRTLEFSSLLMDADDPFAAADLATEWQAEKLGVELRSVPPPEHDIPSDAVLALSERHGVVPSAEQREQVAALDELPIGQREALVDVVNAFLALEDVVAIAYTSYDSENRIGDNIDYGLVLGARNIFLSSVNELYKAFDEGDVTTSSSPIINLCPAISIEIAGSNDLYEENCVLILDYGGNDIYHNNAGGNKLAGECGLLMEVEHAAAALIDFEGDDIYGNPNKLDGCGINGGAYGGVGILIDYLGYDSYYSKSRGVNGGGTVYGMGFLMDIFGNDFYYSSNGQGANGGGDEGFGTLIDLFGDDVFNAEYGIGVNGGTYSGTGFLFDQSGNDIYDTDYAYLGVNGGGSGGVGFLLDEGGNDYYTGGDYGTNGGSTYFMTLPTFSNHVFGSGFLYDYEGDDTYKIRGYYLDESASINGGADKGMALLLDTAGTDTYQIDDNPASIDETIAPKGQFGAQIDIEPTYGAGCNPLVPSFGDTVTCWVILNVFSGEDDVHEEETVTVPLLPTANHDAGCDPLIPSLGDTLTCWAWVEVNGNRIVDEERTETVPDPLNNGESQPVKRSLLHEDHIPVVPAQDVPPEDQEGTETPDYPGTGPVPTPDYPGTGPEETPDYPGTGPVPTPAIGERVATVTVRDDGLLLCVDVTPEGSGPMEVTCVDRTLLGPADGQIPRGDTPVLFLDEDETPDVPGTGAQPVPDVPGTPSQEVPDVPGTPPQEVPDVPPIPGGTVGSTPEVTVTLDASYWYDPAYLRESVRVLGQGVWTPVATGSEGWYLANGDEVGFSVTISIYEDGVHQASVPVSVPYLGQVIAASEKTAGTL